MAASIYICYPHDVKFSKVDYNNDNLLKYSIHLLLFITQLNNNEMFIS